MRLIFIIFYFSIALTSYSQSNYMGYTYPEKLPKDRYKSQDSLKKLVARSIPQNLRDSVEWKAYIDKNAAYSNYAITSGYIYPDWQSMEGYLNEILELLISRDTIDKYGLHVYPTNSPYVNAFALPSGSIYFNVGMFAVAKNEAMIAAILGHEIAHHLNRDMANTYYNSLKDENKNNGLLDILFRGGFASDFEFNRGQEEKADIDGWQRVVDAGYSIEGAKEIYRLFNEMAERNRKLLKFSRVIAMGRTHPTPKNRVGNLQEFTKKQGSEGRLFLVSKEKFIQLREKSRIEMMRHLLKGFDFTLCMERALEFHIFEPDNPIYIYYILESIRRHVYTAIMNSRMEKEEFIMKQHFDEKEIDSYLVYAHLTKSVLHKNNLKYIMYADSAALATVSSHPFFNDEEEEFKSYLEAKDYFANLAEKTNCTECYLTLGAYDYMRNYAWYPAKKNKKQKEPIQWLVKYLEQPNAIYKDYAKAMNNHELLTEDMNKYLLILRDISYTKDDENGNPVDAYEEAEKAEEKYIKYMQESAKKLVNNAEVKTKEDFDNLHDRMVLEDIDDMVYVANYAEFGSLTFANKVLKPHVFDPDYWRFMKKYQLNTIDFVNISYKDRFTDWFEVKVRGFYANNHTRNCYKVDEGTSNISDEEKLKKTIEEALKEAVEEREHDN